MPEGPEVTTLTAAMRHHFPPNKYVLTSLDIISGRYADEIGKSPEGWDQLVQNLPLSLHSVHEKGKFIYFQLDRNISLWSTLGMSGSWTMRPNPRHLRLRLNLEHKNERNEKNIQLCYADSRNFGTFKVCFDPIELETRLQKLGKCWLHDEVTPEVFRALLKKKGKPQRRRSLAVLLMDQTKTSGIGNYILSECLFAARIHPWAQVGSLNDTDIDRLYDAITSIIWTSARSQKEVSMRRFEGKPLSRTRHTQAQQPSPKLLQSEDAFSTPEQRKNSGGGCGGHFELLVYGKQRSPEGFNVIRTLIGPHKRTIWWVKEIQTEGGVVSI